MDTPVENIKGKNRTAILLVVAAFAMLGLGFASKPLYDTFCKITGYGGTTRQAQVNTSPVIDRDMRVSFDSNVSADLPWSFKPDVPYVDVKVGQSTLAYYKVTNTSDQPVTGIATFNVTPIKAAPYFTKTECFCFTEQTLQPGETVDFPVIFYVDSLIEEERRNDDVKDITLSYTFFESEETDLAGTTRSNKTISALN
jgi:cytochrome c oxidase assembly protein subunit 11